MIVGCFFRYWEVSIVQLFIGEFMKQHADRYNEFSSNTAIASFIGAPIATLMTGYCVDRWGPRSEMVIPIILTLKALSELPFNLMTFYQPDFDIAMYGIYLEFFIAKGWPSCAILAIKTVCDPEIAYLGISMFIIIQCLNQMVAANIMAFVIKKLSLDPISTKQKYSLLITANTTIPCILCCPFFICAGVSMIRKRKQLEKELGKQKVELMRKFEMSFMKNFFGGETGMEALGH